MTSRTRAGLALVATLAALGAAASWYVHGLTAISPPTDGADPARSWECVTAAVNGVPTPPPCLSGGAG